MKKQIGKLVAALITIALCVTLARTLDLDLETLAGTISIDLEMLLKVGVIIGLILAAKYLLKLLISLIRFEKAATVFTLLSSGIDYIALILMVVWSLRIMGADINGIIAGLGILALIIGMSAEGIIEDMTTGIFMLFEREFKVGDIIEVDDFAGRVSEIGIRTTTLIDNAGNEKIFNNSSLKYVLNRSSHLSKAVVDIELPDSVDVKKIVNADYGDIVCLGLEEIGVDSVIIRFVKETEEIDIYDTRRRMNEAILAKLKKMKIK